MTTLVIATCAGGSVAGAVLLLALPPRVFEAIVPWLILFTCVLVGLSPTLNRRLRDRRGADFVPRHRMSPVTTFFAATST